MSDSGDDIDSRTAAVGAPRSRSNAPSLHSDTSSRPTKRQRRTASRDNRDVKDFVPRGAAFTAQSLEVDPDETSSSGSSSNSSDDDAPEPTAANPNAGSTAPVISWNQGKRNAVRTTLGRPKANGAGANGAATKQFNSVNDKYWRPRSSSVSSGEGHRARQATNSDMNEDTSDEDDDEEDSQSDSDDSESLDSEEDDSIMLNIGTKPQGTPDNHSPESAVANGGRVNGQVDGSAYQTSPATSKEQAFQAFSRKYPTAPVILLDLTPSDMQTQLVFFYWDRPGIKLDLQSPPGCIECLQQGHLADLCPTKECVHCGKWDLHPSSSCPLWRRCQRCRERGHDEGVCPSALKSSASEVPCDLCGSPKHLESQCDYQWKFPTRESSSQRVVVSISCAHCANRNHIIGDCPSLSKPLPSTSFTLAGIDPSNITNLNEGANRLPPPPPRPGAAKGPRNKGRRGRDPTPSSDSEDMMPRGGRRPLPQARGKPRGAIKFSGAVAPKGPSKPQQKSQGFRGSSRGGGSRGRGAPRGGRGRRGK